MFGNYRTKPYVILCYEALFRSLKEKYRTNETLYADFNRYYAGFRGEKEVDYKLALYPHKDFIILHDIRLKIFNNYFQIDTLILTKKFICILEIKNISGELEYDPVLHQLIQKKGENEKGYKDPILQAKAQKENLKTWFQKLNINVPIETLAIISNPATIVRIKDGDTMIYNKLIHTESLHEQLDRLNEKYKEDVLNKSTLKKISNAILMENDPYKPNLLKTYNVYKRHLIIGIPCYNCQHSPMNRSLKKWFCPKCSTVDYKAHERKILDYFLLYKDTITNNECRNLLQTTSPKTAYTILSSMNLKYSGKNSGRKYHAPFLRDFPQDANFLNKNRSILDFNDAIGQLGSKGLL
ncbi:nuclease-related domain-containing protein [Virgibacillus ndiopensis]|uniref:nuclease-related domain-containing protein n=1 Tax=Virgibacillus ndiopensis TaxID=2004408 RepID=UPI00159B8E82|nr:nuclease-related domain-containing protein [Virgibacillus ndiopensis]